MGAQGKNHVTKPGPNRMKSFGGKFLDSNLQHLSFLVSLDLRNNYFHGNLPEELSHLRRLRFVRLTSNSFTGEIPIWFGHFPELQFLFLDSNGFSGFISPPISNLSKLETLNLRDNFLGGNIPEKMGNLSVLRELYLFGDDLVGQIPLSLCKFSHLQVLYLSNNRLSGHIPKEIGNLEKLKELYLITNNLTGTIPREIGNLQNLHGLNLEWNQITGSIPREIGNLTMLTELYFANNSLTGTIPRELGNLYRLENLQLPYNGLNGSISRGIFNLSALRNIDLASNLLSGNLPRDLGYRLPKLLFIELDGNNLGGVIPVSISNCSQLRMLELSINGFTGSIPDALGDLRLLQYLDLYGNYLTSDPTSMELSFITSLTKCKNLVVLGLGTNPLNGLLPASIGNLSATLQKLYIGTSEIKGTIPSQAGNLTNLILLALQSNHLTGGIPTAFKNLQNLQGNNFLASAIPNSFWNLKDPLRLNLSSNSLNGSLPLEVGNLKAITSIDISANQFSGDIPSTTESFGNMLSLQGLYLSHNNLSGYIPKSLEALRDLKDLDVSYNHLSGEIPSGGHFANFTAESFLFNDALCGDSRFHVPPCPRTNSIHRSRTKKVLLFVFAPLGIASVVVAALAIVFRRYWKNYRDSKGTNMVLVPTQERVSYYDLLRATDGYSESNLLGIGSFGSVYKGILNDGRSIAVKVFNLELEGVLKSFDVECEVLKNLRHRNLVKVISGCSNQDFRALLLEYMCNGSLEKWLYSDNDFLDTLQRLNIMIDVASAVQYLHEEYSTPVIHCDLKPSNVLLDEDMVAHVSDFGVAKMLEKEESFAWTKTLATIGYIAPEYGSEGLISAKCDVYSYGIMLMEVFSRRKPNDEMFAGNLNLKSWINDSLPNSILRVIDAKLLKREDENFTEKLEGFSSIMELALKCVRESPTDRLSMKVVLETLKKIKLKFMQVRQADE
ncbi:receptor kinase-like protein Xa21 [Coffea eugenioides]|uniref:receptor kinase-like protein Xa21 n=1 Tax=Coffea eugenioides TaxID=49369 RepID=UPI000F606275|nr:receptor kinase-like protein Xa21 [Coffea eugenioides]